MKSGPVRDGESRRGKELFPEMIYSLRVVFDMCQITKKWTD